jgi:hypothetical protein
MKYYVDFSGYCEVEASSSKEAVQAFWSAVNDDKPLPCNVYEIQCVEEKEENFERIKI